jgi:hypothetical protein
MAASWADFLTASLESWLLSVIRCLSTFSNMLGVMNYADLHKI